jgi:SNF2 family DNA or RNA helicase
MSSKLLKILIKKSTPETRKKAERLLKSGNLIFSYQENNTLHALFEDKKNEHIECSLPMGDGKEQCTCQDKSPWCLHTTATAMHYLKTNDLNNTGPLPQTGYSGLKAASFSNHPAPTQEKSVYLKLWVENEPPHAPSKWEKCLISVKIYWGQKEYAGNMNNLRQLNFGQGIGAGLQITQFSPQERQIIRFLSLNAEPDGHKMQLDAETSAEFFHSLVTFHRCYFNQPFRKDSPSSQLGLSTYSRVLTPNFFVHREIGEVILNYTEKGDHYKLKPALLVNSKIIPIKNFRILIGRSGCWLGIDLDYWWIPGDVDLIWLRSFLLAKPAKLSSDDAKKVIADAEFNGIKAIKSNLKNSLPVKKCTPLYDAHFSDQDEFILSLSFTYGDQTFTPGGQNSSGSGKYGWKRDRKMEHAYEAELTGMGFTPLILEHSTVYKLKNPETAGLFIDKVVLQWYKEERSICFSANFADIINGRYGIPELLFSSHILDETDDIIKLSYSISNIHSRNAATWKELQRLTKKNQSYLYKKGRITGRISENLRNFITSTADFTQIDKESDNVLKIPKSTLLYWGQAFEKLTGYLPVSIKKLQSELEQKQNKPTLQEKNGKRRKENNPLFRGDLRSYQKEGVEWIRKMLSNNLNAILADEMGLGKTIQTIALLCRSREEFPDSDPSLVLCPSSLVENWYMEFQKFAPELNVIMLRGINRDKEYGNIQNADAVISSYTIAGRDIDKLKKQNFFYLVLDEAQHIKNPSTVNAVTSKAITAKHKLVLTGTPLENTPQELWSIFDFLHPKMLGSLNSFKNRYSGIHTDESMQQDLAVRTAPFILRRKKIDVEPDIPDKIVQTLYCDMPPKQREIYEDFREDGRSRFDQLVKSGKNSRFDLLTNLLRLRQICCHPSLLINTGMDLPEIPSAKTELLQELLLESIDSGHKVLLFSQFTSFLSIIRKWLNNRDIPFEYLDGTTKDRLQRVNHFNNSPEIPLFLLSLKAGGVGLNLTSADRVIIYDPWWNPAVEAQATDRTHRIGQKKSVYSMKLVVKNSIEEKILKLQKQKQRIFQNLVENQSTSLKTLSNEDIEFLLE